MKLQTNYNRILLLLVLTGLISACGDSEPVNNTDAGMNELQSTSYSELEAQAALLEAQIMSIKDVNDIKRLQNAYGYYLDRSDWDNILELLTDDATAEYGNGGVYIGPENIKKLFYGIGYGENNLQVGQIREHIQLQPVITVSEDGLSAEGRWRVLGLLGQFEEYARWQTGPYENDYRKEDGVWKISRLHWLETFTVPFDGGWSTKMELSNVADRAIPEAQAPPSIDYEPWPGVSLLPFHYPNPVTGK